MKASYSLVMMNKIHNKNIITFPTLIGTIHRRRDKKPSSPLLSKQHGYIVTVWWIKWKSISITIELHIQICISYITDIHHTSVIGILFSHFSLATHSLHSQLVFKQVSSSMIRNNTIPEYLNYLRNNILAKNHVIMFNYSIYTM